MRNCFLAPCQLCAVSGIGFASRLARTKPRSRGHKRNTQNDLLSRAGPRFADRRVQFGTWSEDSNRRPGFADEKLAVENNNCLEDSASALFAFLLVLVGGCEIRTPTRSGLLAKPSTVQGVIGCETRNPKRVWVGATWAAGKT